MILDIIFHIRYSVRIPVCSAKDAQIDFLKISVLYQFYTFIKILDIFKKLISLKKQRYKVSGYRNLFPDYCSWISDFVTSHHQLVNKSEIIFIPNGGFGRGFKVYCSVLSVRTFHQHKLESRIFIGRKYLEQILGKFAFLCWKLVSSPKKIFFKCLQIFARGGKLLFNLFYFAKSLQDT